MMPCLTDRRNVSFAGVILLVVVVFASGCGRPPDEAWLRCVGFQQSAETISVLEGNLKDKKSSTVDVEFENSSLAVGQKVGVGVLVNRARIDYRMSGFSPPAADFPLNLYISPSVDGSPTTGTLTEFPLVPASLKQWLIDAGVGGSVVELTARVTFYGIADDGAIVETAASLGIELTNSASTSPDTLPTLTVAWKSDVSRAAAETTGAFTVFRSDHGSSLTVLFNNAGSGPTKGTDYDIDSPVVISGTADSVEVKVTPITTSGITGTVFITLLGSTDYLVGEPKTAQLKILP